MFVQHAERPNRSQYNDGVDGPLPFLVAPLSRANTEPTCADDVIITPELCKRMPRAANSVAELAAWKLLAQVLPADPSTIFNHLAEALVQACDADSAGVTLEERRDPSGELRWVGAAGQLAPRDHDRMPRHSPSGTVIERQHAELFCRPDSFYPSLQRGVSRVEESLVFPWQLKSGRRGAVWIISYDPSRHFDLENLRMVESLATFVDLVMRHSDSEEGRRSQEALASAARLANELAHAINNPLQALINSLHLISLPLNEEHLLQARIQAGRLSELVEGILQVRRLNRGG